MEVRSCNGVVVVDKVIRGVLPVHHPGGFFVAHW
jgi:hypothetical protein